ncbi:hypothetical protein Dda_9254 [Drechslerella dactyloides]|uniref:Uncharacterized protein n=1 Tax=Drechslerella dactyloides TaxID=74499 RepID=A0AAD6IPP6_DREDA|nr:hypothetical protein Dda_9254 [Drechslerella dactyloides]
MAENLDNYTAIGFPPPPPGSVCVCIIDQVGRLYVNLNYAHFIRLAEVEASVQAQLAANPQNMPILAYPHISREAIYHIFEYCAFQKLRPHVYRRDYPVDDRKMLLKAVNALGCWGLKLQLLKF